MKHRAWKLMLCLALVMSFAIGLTGALAARVPTVMILKVTADGARVRTGSENGNEIITSLRKNTKVFYMGANDGAFCLIRTVDGIFGYVYRGFLEGYGVARLDQIYYAAEEGVRMYRQASTNSSHVAKLVENECVLVFVVRGGWAFVKRLNGASGFMRTSDLISVMG